MPAPTPYTSTVGEGYNVLDTTGFDKNNPAWGYTYADQGGFQNQAAGAIYNQISTGFNSPTSAPQAQYSTLGKTALYGGATTGPTATANNTQLANVSLQNAPTLNTAADTAYQGAQNTNINALSAMAQGKGPSVAAQTAQNQASQNTASTMAMLGSQRGGSNPALAQRAALQAKASNDQQAAQNAVTGRVSEETAAQGALTSALSGARGQSQTTAQTQANLSQSANAANQSAWNQQATTQANLNQNNNQFNVGQINSQAQANTANIQNAQLADTGALNAANLQTGQNQQAINLANQNSNLTAEQMGYNEYNTMLQDLMGQGQTDTQNAMAYQTMISNQQQAVLNAKMGQATNNQAQTNSETSSGLQAAAAAAAILAAMSDRSQKKKIKPADRPLRSFLDVLTENHAL